MYQLSRLARNHFYGNLARVGVEEVPNREMKSVSGR